MKLDEIVSFSPISRYINIEIRYNINETRICIKCISTKIWIRLYMFLIRVFSIHLFFALACIRVLYLPCSFIRRIIIVRQILEYSTSLNRSLKLEILFLKFRPQNTYTLHRNNQIYEAKLLHLLFFSQILYLSTRILEFAIEFSKTCDINYNYRVIPPAFTQRFSGSRWNTVSKSSPAGYV